MAEEHGVAITHEGEAGKVEVTDRGLFGFGGKKEEKAQKGEEEVLVTGVENIHLEEEEKKHGLLDKLHRSHSSSSSSSSDEEEGEGENKEKKKKKKGLKEKVEEKLHGEKKEGEKVEVAPQAAAVPVAGPKEDTAVVVEKVEETVVVEAVPEEEKKGFLEKIKDKLPGHNKKATEEGPVASPLPPPPVVESGDYHVKEQEGEKKGFLEKIKEKLPGYHPKSGGEEIEKTAAST